jgi:hypothetical protein
MANFDLPVPGQPNWGPKVNGSLTFLFDGLQGKYTKPTSGIPLADLDSATRTTISGAAAKTYVDTALAGKYTKPSDGIPLTDLDSATRTAISSGGGGGGYVKPASGIPKTDLASDVQNKLNMVERFKVTDHGGGGANNWRVRLAVIDGVATTNGAHAEFLFAGTGDYGNPNRGTILVHVAQRGSFTIAVKAWGWNVENTASPVELYTVYISEFKYELWAKTSVFTQVSDVHVLSSRNVTMTVDMDTTDLPVGDASTLVYYPITSMTSPISQASFDTALAGKANTTHTHTLSQIPEISGSGRTLVQQNAPSNMREFLGVKYATPIYVLENGQTAADVPADFPVGGIILQKGVS